MYASISRHSSCEPSSNSIFFFFLTSPFSSTSHQTYIGPVLIAVNPYRLINGLYGKGVIKNYQVLWPNPFFPFSRKKKEKKKNKLTCSKKNKIKQKGRYYFEEPPHVYAIAEDSYHSLLTEGINQAIIITGESGSGNANRFPLSRNQVSSIFSSLLLFCLQEKPSPPS
jgi:myosin heavy subunit